MNLNFNSDRGAPFLTTGKWLSPGRKFWDFHRVLVITLTSCTVQVYRESTVQPPIYDKLINTIQCISCISDNIAISTYSIRGNCHNALPYYITNQVVLARIQLAMFWLQIEIWYLHIWNLDQDPNITTFQTFPLCFDKTNLFW